MSDELNENLNVEELSTEDKKKAINLQDLIYVKKYIDNNHYSKAETDDMLQSTVEAEVAAKTYGKSEIYTKTETDNTFYKKTDDVNNAKKINNLEIKNNSDGVLTNENYIIPQKKILSQEQVELPVVLNDAVAGVTPLLSANSIINKKCQVELQFDMGYDAGNPRVVVDTRPFIIKDSVQSGETGDDSSAIYSEKFKLKGPFGTPSSIEIEVIFQAYNGGFCVYLTQSASPVSVTVLKVYEIIE